MALALKVRMSDVIQNGTLRNYYVNGTVCGYQFDVRLGYYRGHYLSVIEKLGVEIDNQSVDSKDITFCLGGKEFAVDELKYQISEFWTILTSAMLMIRKPGGLQPGEHSINLVLMLRSPYLPMPGVTTSHSYVPIDSCEQKIVALREE
jgi:hypothetical protein